ncbi:MAG TPA: NADH-quinone oxidoreductase subunit L [Vicinamibacterales bacterium]|jgi:NADH-quinone oxidoreductase subunit L|nr:NADH-quinone oxidoreductase subunit L [Vicinamibacterales bacterium]
MISLIPLIPLLPFAGFVVNSTLGKRLPKSVSGGLASLVMVVSFLISAYLVWQLSQLAPDERLLTNTIYRWIASGELRLDVTFLIDPLSAVMLLVITGIGSLIHIYSTAYMHDEVDGEFARYFSYLNLFAAFMLVLVLGSSFPVLFVGWEGVGLCSYLLIGFWFKKKSAADAGKKAFVVNRIGDYAFLLGMFALFAMFGTLEVRGVAEKVAAMPPEAGFGLLSLATLLLFIGATGKSAQIPLYVWLPDAMEGPTPVSALIHAATMVTAGVYMIGRNAVLFSHTPDTMTIVAVIGAATALMAGTIGLVQNDIKRVLAYSTVSQLGYMFLAMGVGAFGAGIFHLYTHAFFKACLFLGSGAVIHALHGEQDIRNMGGLRKELPITYWTFLIGSIAIAGVPPLAGFFSKDEILFETLAHSHTVLWVIGIITSFLTATYMFRLVFLTFHGERRHDAPAPADAHGHAAGHGHDAHGHGAHGGHLHDAPPAMALALIVLAIGSVAAGWVGIPHAIGGSNGLHAWLEPSFTVAGAATAGEAAEPGLAGESEAATEGLERTLMVFSSVVGLLGIAVAFGIWIKRRDIAAAWARSLAPIHTLLLNKYYVDELYDATVVTPVQAVSREGLWRGVDVGIIDGAVNGVATIVDAGSMVLRRLQTGSVRAYAGSLFIGVVLMLGYYLWR